MRFLAFVLVVASAASPARADDAQLRSPAARAHFERAMEHYRADALADARRELDAAYVLEPAPFLLYARAQVARLLDGCPAALPLYREFLLSDPSPSEAADARANIARCEPEPVAPPPEPAAVVLATTSAPVLSTTSAPVVGPRWFEDPLGGVLVAVAGVALVVGGAFTVASVLEESSARDAVIHDDYAEQIDAASRDRAIGWIALSLFGVAAVAAVVRYATVGDAASIDHALLRF